MKRLAILAFLLTCTAQAQIIEVYSGTSSVLEPSVFSDNYAPVFTTGISATLPLKGRASFQPFVDYSHYSGETKESAYSLAVNAGFNIKLDLLTTRFRPYILSGMSLSYLKNDNARINKQGLSVGNEYDNSQIAQKIQVGAGLSFDISTRFLVFTQANYSYTPQETITTEEGFVVAGVGYRLR